MSTKRVIAYPEDRARLLRCGYMQTTKYSGRLPERVGGDIWREMQQVAEQMGLMLTEPTLIADSPDWTGNRMVTVRAGVADSAGDT